MRARSRSSLDSLRPPGTMEKDKLEREARTSSTPKSDRREKARSKSPGHEASSIVRPSGSSPPLSPLRDTGPAAVPALPVLPADRKSPPPQGDKGIVLFDSSEGWGPLRLNPPSLEGEEERREEGRGGGGRRGEPEREERLTQL